MHQIYTLIEFVPLPNYTLFSEGKPILVCLKTYIKPNKLLCIKNKMKALLNGN